jgi:membrane-bound serine protease (ClpP class)
MPRTQHPARIKKVAATILLGGLLLSLGALAEGDSPPDANATESDGTPAEEAQPEPEAASLTVGAGKLAVKARIEGAITPVTEAYFNDAFAHAEEKKADLFLIQMDTPGGLLEATRNMVQKMLRTDIPVVVYVGPEGARAGSAGVFLTMAAHVAAMSPTSHIGAAHPVQMFGGDMEGDMRDKIENDTAAWARSIAEARGKNQDFAEAAVRESESIPASTALEDNVVDLLAESETDLLEKIHGRVVKTKAGKIQLNTKDIAVVEFERSGQQSLMDFFADPNLLYLLMLMGLLGVFIEFKNPGLIVPGVVGGVCLAVVLGIQVLPVNWFGVLLILGAAALFIAEIYVTSFGLLGAGGLVCLILGSYLLFDVPGSQLRVDTPVIWSVALTFSGAFLGIGYLLFNTMKQGATSGPEAMQGELAQVHVAIGPHEPGKIHYRGAFWAAHADVAIPKGADVRIVRLESTQAFVEPVDEIAKKGEEAPISEDGAA